MKLAKLELSGFKSFADYTEFLFDDGITSIVGPNGCGKSNVVDAVKWVLGETSAKSLRGDAMLDVIFNGSASRKPMGMAEVSLSFTNHDRRLPMDTDTVKITRRLYRDATSEYLINNQIARLKDIRELFLDTGIGVDAYSLIEQGRVSALLESNSVDRREIFEEAAGISRFKQRKKEALRKLEKTDQNLAQSQLVLDEVEKQLRSIKIQAGRARNYQEYAARLRELRSAYVMQEYETLHKKLVAQSDHLSEVVDELAAVRRQMEEKRTRQSELQLELESATESARKAERELLAAQSDHASATQRADFARQQIAQLTEQQSLLAARQSDLTQNLSTRTAEVDRLNQSLAQIDQKLRDHEAEVASAALEQEQAAKAIAGLNRSVDEHKSKMIDLMRQIARLHNDISGLKINQENLANQRTRLSDRQSQLNTQITDLKSKVADLDTQKTSLTEQSQQLHTQADAVRAEQQSNNQKLSAISQDLARHREHRSALASRQSVLNDLQSKREGVSQTIRELLTPKGPAFPYIAGLLSDFLSTTLENAPLIEAALGDLQNALIITDSTALAADSATWQKLAGRVTLLPTDQLLAHQPSAPLPHDSIAAIPLINLVECNHTHALLIHQLLAKTFLVNTLQDAQSLAATIPTSGGVKFVTRSGEILDTTTPTPTLTLGDISKKAGTISRRAEVAKLTEELATIESLITDLTAQIAACDQTSRALDASQQSLRTQLFQTDSKRAEISAQLQQTSSHLQRTLSEAPLITGEIDSIDRQSQQAADRQKECEQKSQILEDQQKELDKLVHDLGAQLIVRQHQVSELAEAATKARVAMGQVQEQRTSLSRELAAAKQLVNQHTLEIQRLAGELSTVANRIEDANATIAKSAEQLETLAATIATAQTQLEERTQQVATSRAEHSQIANSLTSIMDQTEQLARREHELSLAKNELSVRIETLIEHTMEELQINLHDRYHELQAQAAAQQAAADEQAAAAPSEDAPPTTTITTIPPTDWDAIASEITDLKGKISRLGNVNLDAISEQSTLEERFSTLTASLLDITDAKRQLEELIVKINDDSRQRFADTFATVRAEFQDMFRRLFGGGKADLILENPDDILESGIEIIARPPGKEPQSMSLLSGGEKTMTAVALVMSIFKSKPSPFCILDEVDAALDEANTTRFAAIIQDFVTFSQFIVITHNKRTMSVANTLYGVTMQEQGISKRVAVRFDQKGSTSIPAPGAPKLQEPAAA